MLQVFHEFVLNTPRKKSGRINFNKIWIVIEAGTWKGCYLVLMLHMF